MTDLWSEGLKKQYKLTQPQCDELRGKVNTGEAEVLFLLDAYDELSAGNIGKSLYQVIRTSRHSLMVSSVPALGWAELAFPGLVCFGAGKQSHGGYSLLFHRLTYLLTYLLT